MDWITPHISIGMFDETPPEGAAVVDLRNIPDHQWIPSATFRERVTEIQEHLEAGRKVFVHCIGGISRSPTIVAAWLALATGESGAEALRVIENKRPQIQPHPEQVSSLNYFLRSA